MAFLSQAMNVFNQSPILGQVDMIPSPNVVPAQILSTSSATSIQVGDAVKLVDGTSSTILVDKCTGPTDGPVWGVIGYNNRKNIYVPGDLVEILLSKSYVHLLAGAAINRGAKVTTTASTTTADPTVATVATPSTQYVTGIAVDKIASGALGRIEIAPSFNAGV
jgi:hypothetical protein